MNDWILEVCELMKWEMPLPCDDLYKTLAALYQECWSIYTPLELTTILMDSWNEGNGDYDPQQAKEWTIDAYKDYSKQEVS